MILSPGMRILVLVLICSSLDLIGPHWLVQVRLVPNDSHPKNENPCFGPHLLLIGPHWLVQVRLVPNDSHPKNENPYFGPHQLLIGPH